MFYTSKSIRLHNRALAYLELIEKANARYENKNEALRQYEASKSIFDLIRLMTTRDNILNQMNRWERLSNWLVYRYQNTLMGINMENEKQLSKLLTKTTA